MRGTERRKVKTSMEWNNLRLNIYFSAHDVLVVNPEESKARISGPKIIMLQRKKYVLDITGPRKTPIHCVIVTS